MIAAQARWRQWSPGSPPDVDRGASPEAVTALEEWLRAIQSGA